MQWAVAGVLASEPLLNACLHDQRYDKQCEDNRGDWLWNLITVLGVTKQLRDPVLMGLRTMTEVGDANQLCELAVRFAQNGDEEFRTELYDFIGLRRSPDSPDVGEIQLLRLEGERAFLFLARLQYQLLATSNWNWDWDDTFFIDRMTEFFGEPRVRELLNSSSEPEVRRFARAWAENTDWSKKSTSQHDAHVQKMRAIPVNEVIDAIKSEHQVNWLRGWGMHADERALEVVFEHLWAEHDPARIIKFLRVFSNRPVPVFDSRLIDLCSHADEDVRRWALLSLEKNSHPLIRTFALKQLRERALNESVACLFIKNFAEGDERRLIDFLELPEDAWPRHSMLMDLIKMLEVNKSADSSILGQIIYFHTPCQNCRSDAARLLFDQGHMPTWMEEECQFDAEENCRKLVEAKSRPN